MKTASLFFLSLFFLSSLSTSAQQTSGKITQLLQATQSYIIHKTKQPLAIDGLPHEDDWKEAKWTSYFTDIEGTFKPKPTYDTRVKMLWDEENLYLYAELEEPHIWGTLKNHDDIIFHDNDFEVFISNEEFAPEYFEFEINTLGTIFDLLMTRPYRNGGKPIIDWDAKGLKSAVHIEGTNNDPTDIDKFWAVEMAIPFKNISLSHRTLLPKDGNTWRINFSRVQWKHDIKDGKYEKRRNENGRFLPEDNWVWSPQGVVNMHYPERWGYLQFSQLPAAEGKNLKFEMPEKEQIKQIAWLLYYLQKEYHHTHQRYSSSTEELIKPHPEVKSLMKQVTIETLAENDWFTIKVLKSGTNLSYRMDQNGILSPISQAH